jgi:O-acetyl-ADP-ribose deacetylase (regulator of RNase III)
MIHYLIGDATCPTGPQEQPKIIAHIVNDKGGWGAGFVLALSKKWKEPEEEYRNWAADTKPLPLGYVQFVYPENHKLAIANMVAQHGYGTALQPPIRYQALRKCLYAVNLIAKQYGATVHMPRIGCGLAGGTWDEVSKIIEEEMPDLEVFVYDLATTASLTFLT